jgi:hypothetical protein
MNGSKEIEAGDPVQLDGQDGSVILLQDVRGLLEARLEMPGKQVDCAPGRSRAGAEEGFWFLPQRVVPGCRPATARPTATPPTSPAILTGPRVAMTWPSRPSSSSDRSRGEANPMASLTYNIGSYSIQHRDVDFLAPTPWNSSSRSRPTPRTRTTPTASTGGGGNLRRDRLYRRLRWCRAEDPGLEDDDQ